MKKIFLVLTLLAYLSFNAWAQVPQAISYQAVARDAGGNPITNKDVVIEVTIRSGSPIGTIVWQEGHISRTNELGIVNLNIGEGASTNTGTATSFSKVNWGAANHYIGVRMDFGNGLKDMGVSKLLSVPYALYAGNASSGSAQTLSINGNQLSISGGNSVTLPISSGNDADADSTNEIQSLILNGNSLSISKGNSILLPGDNDTNSSNELQTLSVNGSNLTISNGNTVAIPTAWTKVGSKTYFTGRASIGTKASFTDSTRLTITDSTKKNIPALLFTYNTGCDNYFKTSRNIVAYIQGNTGTNEAIFGKSFGISSGTNKGIYGFSKDALENYGVQGIAYGNTSADSNFGVYGIAAGPTTNDGFTVGVYGEAKGSSNYNRGVDGRTSGVGLHNEGLFGHSIGAGSGQNIGNYAFAQGSSFVNYGVLAETRGTGNNSWNIALFADANGVAKTNYAIYAYPHNATTNYAGYFAGDVTITGTLTNPSDASLKEDVEKIASSIKIVKQLNPVTYNYKEEMGDKGMNLPKGQQYGFVAQELEKVLPELVTTQVMPVFSDDNPYNSTSIEKFEYKGINYIGIIPILTSAIKEQQNTIEEQGKQIEVLTQNYQSLVDELEDIKKKLEALEK